LSSGFLIIDFLVSPQNILLLVPCKQNAASDWHNEKRDKCYENIQNVPISSGGPAADVARQDSACLTFASFRYGISVDSAVSQSHSRICGSRLFGGVQGNFAQSMSLAVQRLRDLLAVQFRTSSDDRPLLKFLVARGADFGFASPPPEYLAALLAGQDFLRDHFCHKFCASPLSSLMRHLPAESMTVGCRTARANRSLPVRLYGGRPVSTP